jgi:isopentenyl diphosphate isomerase/L-lactate dehydrogenase-like FMN-dependent dehydrogenase
MPATEASMGMFAEPPTWNDLPWIRDAWRGPLLVKGVLTGDDARRAVDLGADGIIVSNHGGRQLDSAPATLRVLPEVVAAVGDRVEVLLDSGVRRGSDVIKAVALGARAVMIGRAFVYGLAAGGEQGVDDVLTMLRDEIRTEMQLLGCDSVAKLDRTWLRAYEPKR